ncbi:grpE protein homolog 1, mitochondrial [Dermacentor andersoni]|uniref:grpE protein homolog 1, mitochondrial n=1 Tax=Dermacentor andersoni TaxID=34620 RepID=UPI0021550C50|nr:grpE protein homolog 1, mitochondrial-like [Dermacentor andersoni]
MASNAAMCSPMLRQIFRRSSYVCSKSYAPFSARLLFSTATTAPPTEREAETKEEKPAADPSLLASQEENRKLLEQIKTIDDKYKRSLAENENLRVRMQKQIEEARVFGIQKFCKDLLDVADVLSSALSSVPKEAVTPDNPHLQNLYTGLEMTQAQLQAVFRRHGLTQLNPIGMKFDPNEHQAVFVHHDESKEPGTVGVVSKIGYKLKDRTIRPAMVGVVERT